MKRYKLVKERPSPNTEYIERQWKGETTGYFVRDDTLQDIADAWNEGSRIDYRRSNIKLGWPKLADLLDALTQEDTP